MPEFQLGWRQTASATLREPTAVASSRSEARQLRTTTTGRSEWVKRTTYHTSIGKHSHLQSEPDSINNRPASFLYLSLTPQVRSHCSDASPKPCCSCSDARVRGDTLLTMPTAGKNKNSLSRCPCSGADHLFTRGTVPKVHLFFHLCYRYCRGNLSPVTLRYLKVSHERALREHRCQRTAEDSTGGPSRM